MFYDMDRQKMIKEKEDKILFFLNRSKSTELDNFAGRHGLRNIHRNEFKKLLENLEQKGLIILSRKINYTATRNFIKHMTGRKIEPTTTYQLTGKGIQYLKTINEDISF